MSKSLEQLCGAPDGDTINNQSDLEKQLNNINKQMNEFKIGEESIRVSPGPVGHSALTPASAEEAGSGGTHDGSERLLGFPDCNTKLDVNSHNVQFTGSKMFKCSRSNGAPKPLMNIHGAPRGPRLYRPYPVRVPTARAQTGTPNNKLKPRLNKDHGDSRSNEVTPSILDQILEDNASSGAESASDMRAQNPHYHVGQLQFPLVPIDPSLFRLRLQRLNNNEDCTSELDQVLNFRPIGYL